MKMVNMIRGEDPVMAAIEVIPLLVDWGIKSHCYLDDCRNRSNTILVFENDGETYHISCCEECYQKAKAAGVWAAKVNFDKPEPAGVEVVQ